MKVLLVKPGERAKVVEIGDKLEDMQRAVGGNIEAVYPYEDYVALICNEEGKINGMEENRALRTEDGISDIICGPFLITGLSETAFASLPEELISKYIAMFELPEYFSYFDGGVHVLTYYP